MHDQTTFQTDGKMPVTGLNSQDTRIHSQFHETCHRYAAQWLNVKEKGALEVAEGG